MDCGTTDGSDFNKGKIGCLEMLVGMAKEDGCSLSSMHKDLAWLLRAGGQQPHPGRIGAAFTSLGCLSNGWYTVQDHTLRYPPKPNNIK